MQLIYDLLKHFSWVLIKTSATIPQLLMADEHQKRLGIEFDWGFSACAI